MRERCDICRGIKSIRLPVHHNASALYKEHSAAVAPVSNSYRDYPCPECSPKVSEENVSVYSTQHDIDSRIPPAERAHYVMRQAAHMMADKLQESGHMKTVVGPLDTSRMTYPVRTTLGVVSQSFVASMEDRIIERQAEVAEQVVSAAIAKVNHWGSTYGHQGIYKVQAIDSIREALKEVLGARRTSQG